MGQFVLKSSGVVARFLIALLGILRELFTSVGVEHDDERQLLDTDLIGEFNHRTGRPDAGNDPCGWYDED